MTKKGTKKCNKYISVNGYVLFEQTDEPAPYLLVSVQAPGLSPTQAEDQAQFEPRRQSGTPVLVRYPVNLGSTITNIQGHFELNILSSKVKAAQSQNQHGLVLSVFGTTNSEQRHLLRSMHLPPLKPGQTEALVIRLPDKQVQQFLVQTKPFHSVEQSVERLVAAEEENEKFRTLLHERLAPIRQERVAKRREIRQQAKRFAGNLQATPLAIRSSPTYVPKNDNSHIFLETGGEGRQPIDSKPFAARVENAMHESMRKGLAKFQNSDVTSTLIHLDSKDLEAIGISTTTVDDIIRSGVVNYEQLCTLLQTRRGGAEYVRVRDLLDSLDAEDILAPPETNGEVATVVADGPETPGETDEGNQVENSILGQLSDMPTPNGGSSPINRLLISNGRLVWGSAEPQTEDGVWSPSHNFSKSLGQSPADNPAFHDFYNLQIAFEQVWTEAFDPNVSGLVEDLYEAAVDVGDEYAVTHEWPLELQEIDDLMQFLSEIDAESVSAYEPVPTYVSSTLGVSISESDWNQLNDRARVEISHIARQIEAQALYIETAQGWDLPLEEKEAYISELQTRILELQTLAQSILTSPSGARTRIKRLLKGISDCLAEPFAFHIFAPNSVNFGLLLNYRQLWKPGPYQVGDLVSTIPLAPGETRKYSTKQVVKRSRAETELAKALSSRSRELTTTQRADAEIVSRASINSNFKMTTEGTVKFGSIAEIQGSNEFSLDQQRESSRVKKDFREAVLKAAQEYKQERSVQVETSDELTAETTTSGEIKNPNNEITVTYQLWELERQYKVTERIHRVTPVILVAQDIPAPNEITESWLLTHEWVLRRVLLDDSLQIALDYLTNAFAGEEVSIVIRKANWAKQLELVNNLEATLESHIILRKDLRDRMIDVTAARGYAEASELPWLLKGLANIGGVPDPAEETAERLDVFRKSIETQLTYLEETVKAAQDRLVGARESLNDASNAYTQALEQQTNRRVTVDQLRIHVKANILYYMQAIWDHEPPDQRFFRLYHIPVTLPQGSSSCTLREAATEDARYGVPTLEYMGTEYVIESCGTPTLPENLADIEPRQLVEIADLDRPLGYKGNYIIFPLKTCTYLTNFMMNDFFDDYFGVRDPDEAGNYTLDELLEYRDRLLSRGTITRGSEEYEAFQTIIEDKLKQPQRDSDIVVVPTGEIYMEALLGKHALLEDFKMVHRGYDVAKAREEVRGAALENIRYGMRLLQEEPDLEDPEVDKHIVVEGTDHVHVETP